jgi:hypothetical protein
MATASEQLQGELALLGQVTHELRELDARLVAQCDTEQRAFHLCVDQSTVYRSQASIADLLGMQKGDFNCALNADINDRPKYLSRTRQIQLQKICGNRAIDQWADLYEKGLLACQKSKEARRAELLRELKEIESA